jgi:hypothetical protein
LITSQIYEEEQKQFDDLVKALSKKSLRIVLDIITHPQQDNPYTTIKQWLCLVHKLTGFQQVELMSETFLLAGLAVGQYL